MNQKKWSFFIDKGGTFTDIIAKSPEGNIFVHKVLTDHSKGKDESSLSGISDFIPINDQPENQIDIIKVGTTIGTNTLLQKKGPSLGFLTTEGFEDSIKIGYQNRPHIFSLEVRKPPPLYSKSLGVKERVNSRGEILIPIENKDIHNKLIFFQSLGIKNIVVAFLHSLKNKTHEKRVYEIAKDMGFEQITLSSNFPIPKFILRSETAIIDSYLSPTIKNFSKHIQSFLPNAPLFFMQSLGGLVKSNYFQGSNSLLSGPAGGVIGAVKIAEAFGVDKIIGFDMGGTSTDVFHYAGQLERKNEHLISNMKISIPMLDIHTLAAGGGSILKFDDDRFQVGPQSAGSDPGPSCYGHNGPLTITDANLILGRILPESFSPNFGINKNMPLQTKDSFKNFDNLKNLMINEEKDIYEIAEGFINIANQKMALGLEKISKERGIDLSSYSLISYGGAGGQHSCDLAEMLGIKKVIIHPLSSVLSAYGIAKSQIRTIKKIQHTINLPKNEKLKEQLSIPFKKLEAKAVEDLISQGVDKERIVIDKKISLKYQGTFSNLTFDFIKNNIPDYPNLFSNEHLKRFGHIKKDHPILIDFLIIEAYENHETKVNLSDNIDFFKKESDSISRNDHKVFYKNNWYDCPKISFNNSDIIPKKEGPLLIIGGNTNIFIPPTWIIKKLLNGPFIIEKNESLKEQLESKSKKLSNKADPILIEIFNNKLFSIAEQMGLTLEKTSLSVNIKERLDFSCAIFDSEGCLLSNAPHIPVHLGSMEDSVQSIIKKFKLNMNDGDVFLQNDPYYGGTHLPDLTVITPLYLKNENDPSFYIASRGHHADIGGITPGSMPSSSNHIDQEGILINGEKIISKGVFLEENIHQMFVHNSNFPVRDFSLNLADIKAKVAANQVGVKKMKEVVQNHGKSFVLQYSNFIKINAAKTVHELIKNLNSGQFSCQMDNGSKISVIITPDKRKNKLIIDFDGTSEMTNDNFNTPYAVTKASILYVIRTLIKKEIPLNSGCLDPIEIKIPKGSLLDPVFPHAVVAGNVETSQIIVDVLFGALGKLSGSQGTMNNLTFGNKKFQYYETICGGSGAGEGFKGEDTTQTHMTNSRMTDPEILEEKFPVIIEDFSLRQDSGGEGAYKGGRGCKRRIKFLEEVEASLLTGRRKSSSHGLFGGTGGLPGKNTLISVEGKTKDLPPTVTLKIKPGESLLIETPGGGGFGPKDPQS
tara:strand:- start:23 stop:3652 length:3630 start_codon:yes stop_codon:yes gene_type:complete